MSGDDIMALSLWILIFLVGFMVWEVIRVQR